MRLAVGKTRFLQDPGLSLHQKKAMKTSRACPAARLADCSECYVSLHATHTNLLDCFFHRLFKSLFFRPHDSVPSSGPPISRTYSPSSRSDAFLNPLLQQSSTRVFQCSPCLLLYSGCIALDTVSKPSHNFTPSCQATFMSVYQKHTVPHAV